MGQYWMTGVHSMHGRGQSANERVTKRANAILGEVRALLEKQNKTFTLHRLAVVMARDSGKAVPTVQSHIKRLLDGRAQWRVDDMETFTRVLGRPIEALISAESASNVSELSVSDRMLQALDGRLDSAQARELVEMLNLSSEQPDLYGLMWDLCASVLAGGSRGDALLRAARVIGDAEVLEEPRSRDFTRLTAVREKSRNEAEPISNACSEVAKDSDRRN